MAEYKLNIIIEGENQYIDNYVYEILHQIPKHFHVKVQGWGKFVKAIHVPQTNPS